jgi:hypothetical protein
MYKRFFITLLALVCAASAALADHKPLSTNALPLCCQYPIGRAKIKFSDAPVPV